MEKGGLLKAFDKALTTGAKWLSCRGYLMWAVILPTMAVMATNPSLLGIGTQFVSFASQNLVENFLPGWEIIGGATFDAAAKLTELTI